MKTKYIIPLVVIIGLAVLLFFPEPETNIIAYLAALILFIIITSLLIIKEIISKNPKI